MNKNYVTNIRHFLDKNGAFAIELTQEARVMAEELGKIINCVTKASRKTPKTDVRCWCKCNKKKCAGEMDAGINLKDFCIFWHCKTCGDSGSITHWENTFMDYGYRPWIIGEN